MEKINTFYVTVQITISELKIKDMNRRADSLSHRFFKAWKGWIKPRATDPDVAFREQTLRAAFISMVLIWMVIYIIFNLLDWMHFRPEEPFIIGGLIGVLGYTLHCGKITLAGFLWLGVLMMMFYSTLNVSYWFDANYLQIPLIALLIHFLLPPRYVLPVGIGVVIFYGTFAFIQEANGMKPLDTQWRAIESAAAATITAALVIPAELGLLYYLNREFERRNRELKSLNETLEQRVQERTQEIERLYQEQVEVAEKLRAVDQMKSQFLASMNHELRTPLNAILNFTEFVSLGMMGPVNEKQVDALNKSLDSGKHLLALINDVLDMTKIEAGMMTLFIEDNIDLHKDILASVLAMFEPMLKDKPVTFIKQISPDLPKIQGDKRRIKQILVNLLSNAVKFTDEGSITFSVKSNDHHVMFSIVDTGTGIKPEEHALIFEPFKQAEDGIRHANGTGLGLPISKRLVEAHQGKLWMESEPGQGTAFYILLPLIHEKPAEAVIPGISLN